MADSLLETLSRLRSKELCDARAVGDLITAAESMAGLYRCLMSDLCPQDRPIVTHLLQYETIEHEQHNGLSDHLIVSSYLLAIHGNVEDCLLIWDAKMANFSTFLGLSDALLVGAGIEGTLRFLRRKSPRRRWQLRSLFSSEMPVNKAGLAAAAALTHIDKAVKAGRFTDLEVQFGEVKRYCMESLTKGI